MCTCAPGHRNLNESVMVLERFNAQMTLSELKLLARTVMYLKDSMYQSVLFINSWSS
jgi:hypothetical protein